MELAVQENIPLAPLTTLGIGGRARFFVEASDEETAVRAFQFAKERSLPLFVLGGGSNVVVADEGFPGLVLHLRIPGRIEDKNTESDSDEKVFTLGAGEDWDAFVDFAVDRDLAGVECLSGIPGSIGGTPIQNVGAYGQEVSAVIRSVHVFDTATERRLDLPQGDCGFSYRKSLFNTTARGRYIVLAVTYALQHGLAATIRYPDVEQYLRDTSSQPSLRNVRLAVLTIRRRKAMVLSPADPDTRSAGSFFKNPVVDARSFEGLSQQYPNSRIPHYPVNAQGPVENLGADPSSPRVKLAAAWLIEQSGFHKGFPGPQDSSCRVGISSKHTLALINRGGATARELVALMKNIQSGVQERFNVFLEPEPVFVGFADPP